MASALDTPSQASAAACSALVSKKVVKVQLQAGVAFHQLQTAGRWFSADTASMYLDGAAGWRLQASSVARLGDSAGLGQHTSPEGCCAPYQD
jgi:hypothetical protein